MTLNKPPKQRSSEPTSKKELFDIYQTLKSDVESDAGAYSAKEDDTADIRGDESEEGSSLPLSSWAKGLKLHENLFVRSACPISTYLDDILRSRAHRV